MKNKTKKMLFLFSGGLALLITYTALAYDLAKDKVVYFTPYSHLDTQWEWERSVTINTYIPATLMQNFSLLDKYPKYIFNFEGAYRYYLIKQYYPAQYTKLKDYIAKGRWYCAGSWVEASDVNSPSAESVIRQALYGQGYFMDEFGKKSADVFLPDCFGFGFALPSIAAHCGLKGFSTQKYQQWNDGIGYPFSIGRWIGPDGKSVVASIKPGPYWKTEVTVTKTDGDDLKAKSGVWAIQRYFGPAGDKGGAAGDAAVQTLMKAVSDGSISGIDATVVISTSDQLYKDLKQEQIDAMASHTGELLLPLHGTGCLTSWADVKWRNRKNELLGAASEAAAVAANLVAGTSYPETKLQFSWFRFLAHQMHDDITGTSLPEVYAKTTIPAVDSSITEFTEVMTSSNAVVASKLNTNVSDGVPVVVYNPLSIYRKDVVQTVVNFGTAAPAGVQVFDQHGKEVPAQILSAVGQVVGIAFVASVPSVGYAVYQVKPSAANASMVSDAKLKADATAGTVENNFYLVTINKSNGDITQIHDKRTGKDLLSAPSRFEGRTNISTAKAAWRVRWEDVSASPTWYAGSNAKVTVAENGPVRASLKITRDQAGSSFTHYVRLAADSAGMRVEVDNTVDWKTMGILLKAGFPLSCSNTNATFDLGLGTIQRPKMVQSKYEVPAQNWADITNTDNSYGVSILTDFKQGWNKASDNKLQLSLIHSPSGVQVNYFGDQYVHNFKYGVYGHSGSWTNGTVWQAARMNQLLVAFQTTAHTGTLGKEVSFLQTSSPDVVVMAYKKARKGADWVVRVREAAGTSQSGAKISFPSTIKAAKELNGIEEEIGTASFSGKDLTFNLTKYQPRTFSVQLDPFVPTSIGQPALMRSSFSGSVVTVSCGLSNMAKVRLTLPEGEHIKTLAIVDVAGRLIKNLAWETAAHGKPVTIVWDGKDSSGHQVTKGVYLVTLVTNNSIKAARMTILP